MHLHLQLRLIAHLDRNQCDEDEKNCGKEEKKTHRYTRTHTHTFW